MVSDALAQWFLVTESADIEAVDLAEGALKLRLSERARKRASTRATPSGKTREPARIITMCWGDRYITDLLTVTIPAVLAPGNVPAFVEEFDCEFVIITERRLFERVANAPVIRRLLEHCDLRLMPVDDLLSPWYGITLTYALVRGFADLGEAMTRTHLVFLNADFIVADGSYRKLAEVIRGGARLAVSPSYCMVLEQTIDKLMAHYDEQECTLTISRRAMASMIIEHRHNTIRAKTVNQRLFRIHRYDQFYWHVDDRTLLARQMPIAVVYMRPERALAEMSTFWDYGVISQYCPNVAPCVLGDSDDFLMGELRAAATFREFLQLGWPTIDEIAADLSSFTTKDHRDYGRHVLTVHASDLPNQIGDERAKFQSFIDQVDRRLKRPIDYLRHPFWTKDFPRFSSIIVDAREQLQANLEAAHALQSSPEGTVLVRNRREEIRQVLTQRAAIEAEQMRQESYVKARLAEAERTYQGERERHEFDLRTLQKANESAVEEIEKRRDELEQRHQALLAQEYRKVTGRQPQFDQRERSAAKSGSSIFAELAALASRRGPLLSGRSAVPAPAARRPASQPPMGRLVAWLTPIYHKLFGSLPRTTRWHPFHAMLEPAFEAVLATEHRVSNVLVLSSGGPLGSLLVKPLAAKKVTIAPSMVSIASYRDLLARGGGFDLCVCDLSLTDLFAARSLLENIRKYMAPDGKIVLFHQVQVKSALNLFTYEVISGGFPLFGRSRVTFAGGLPTSLASGWFFRALHAYSIFRPAGLAAVTAVLAISAPLARFGAWFERMRRPDLLPKHCTSMTVEIDLAP